LEAWEEGSSGKWARRAEMKVQASAAAPAAAARVIGHDVSPSSFWSLRLRRPPARTLASTARSRGRARSFLRNAFFRRAARGCMAVGTADSGLDYLFSRHVARPGEAADPARRRPP